MYAIIETGGKQYKVSPGEQVKVEKLPGEKGDEISFDNIILLNNGKDVTVDADQLSKVTVKGKLVEQGKGKKIIIFKSKRRKNYKRKYGHRQAYTAVQIEAIEG